jgi:hypothetical protein
MRYVLLMLLVVAGCGSLTKSATTEQKLAKRIGEKGVVEGMLYTVDGVPTVRTTWGLVPLQPIAPITVPMATYVQATGIVERGKLVNGNFIPSHADFRGIRPQHDLVLRQAKVEKHAVPSTQPTTFPSVMP